ncbi:hypothetical protein QCN29_24450 [Streptomyces sp. HNM0663]|uniref:Lipoprotein n=1 Tax=Streptomyces chengmaiensis TaxID=3040919 RepID=A0ABT6HT31_9ACTN|nr:hypothetical protein [Streptomyces chengmaiensis]MDH2391873.1 hypothetical protein [Streptomyces chengmaiensis]
MTSSRTSRGAARRVAALLLGAAVLSGCGIRTTQVPVDAGTAPSRVPCEVSGEDAASDSQADGLSVRIYLMCTSQLEQVVRVAQIPEEKAAVSPLLIARALLDELAEQPSQAEQEAGFATHVNEPIGLSGPRAGDPAGTLRLSRQPEDLPAGALAQIVCTFAENGVAVAEDSVVLGGPGEYEPRGYRCDTRAKERPEGPMPTLSALPPAAASPSASASS